ncbi:hypothetical protein JMJ77_0010371, partial [Colletotrichum scovillei]
FLWALKSWKDFVRYFPAVYRPHHGVVTTFCPSNLVPHLPVHCDYGNTKANHATPVASSPASPTQQQQQTETAAINCLHLPYLTAYLGGITTTLNRGRLPYSCFT